MIKINRNVVITALVCALAGFLSCSILVKVYNKTNEEHIKSIQSLTEIVKQMDERNNKLIDEIEYKNKAINEYENAVSNDSQTLKIMKEELEQARKAAGSTEVSGKGIIVTLNDSNSQNSGVDPAALVIHDKDLLLFVNELNSAGAEAVSINGQRIVSRSSIKCAGSIINVNGVRISTPFVIKAIGNPDVMEEALKFKGGVIDSLKPWGFSVDIEHNNNINIEAYNQGFSYEFSKDD